jgi:hypothetical protein
MKTVNCALIILLLILLGGCNQNPNNTNTSGSNRQNTEAKNDSVSTTPNDSASAVLINDDSALLMLADSLLIKIKNKKYASLTSDNSPNAKIVFSPYGVVDTLKNQKLTVQEIVSLANSKKIINWGTFQGSGEPINLNISQYFARFVYDVDYIKAEKKSLNKILGYDSSTSNIKAVFPNSNFVQFYFSGFKKQYEGMDWKSLVLVFEKINGEFSLIAIVHNEWKI